ncbi:hypothetical protein CL621_01775 [archaeon]|nr:hypothetical protein [archaeon]
MFKLKKEFVLLILIFLLTLSLRLFFVFQTDFFSEDLAYFHLRNTENILETGKPIYFDGLSYSGRPVLYPPFSNYFLAFFSLFLPINLVAKLIPEILISSLVIIVYLISKELTKDVRASLLTALMAGFIPLFASKILNTISIYSFVLPIFFFMIYCMIKIREERSYLPYLVIFSVLLPLTHSTAFLIVFSLIIYFLLVISESWNLRATNKEAIFFVILTTFLIQFLIYKEAFLLYGFNTIWSNTPVQLFLEYFKDINIMTILYEVGILPVVFGFIAIFFGLFRKKRNDLFLLGGVILSTLLLLTLKLISIADGLLFLGLTLVILSSLTIKNFFNYLKLTKFSHLQKHFSVILVILVIVSLAIPFVISANKTVKNIPTEKDIEALLWFKLNIEEEAVVLAPLEEGHLISQITKKSNVLDDLFLLAPDPGERLEDVDQIYTTKSEFKALDLLQKYDVDYIFLSEKTKEKYNITELSYAVDKKCFRIRKYEEPKIYQVREC